MKHKLNTFGLAAQSLLYIAAGVNHFWHTSSYLKIMPPHYSSPEALILATGVVEVLGGIGLLIPATRRAVAIGLIVMLIGYLDVHLYMAENTARFAPLPAWAIYARIPLQFVLIAWAWVYARRRTASLA